MQSSKLGPQEIRSFSSNVLEDGSTLLFMVDGFRATAALAGVNHLDHAIPFDCKINAMQSILRSHKFGDYMYMVIGYYDSMNSNMFKGVSRFGVKYYVCEEDQNQGWLSVDYSATVPKMLMAGVQTILRVYYFRTDGTVATDCIFNFKLHEVVAAGAMPVMAP